MTQRLWDRNNLFQKNWIMKSRQEVFAKVTKNGASLFGNENEHPGVFEIVL